MSDLGRLIHDNKTALEGASPPTPDYPLVLLLLNHSEFGLSQASSATILPNWFPGLSGQNVLIWIEDLTWKAEVPINDNQVRVDELHRKLYDLDVALTRRLAHALKQDKNLGSGWFAEVRDKVKKAKDLKLADFLAGAEQALQNEQNPTGYRLDIKRSTTSLACCVFLTAQVAANQLGTLASSLVRALGLPTPLPEIRDSLFTVLACSLDEDKDSIRLFGRNLLLTAYAGHRFLTASAHASQYPTYPMPPLRSVSLDLREKIARFADFLRLAD